MIFDNLSGVICRWFYMIELLSGFLCGLCRGAGAFQSWDCLTSCSWLVGLLGVCLLGGLNAENLNCPHIATSANYFNIYKTIKLFLIAC